MDLPSSSTRTLDSKPSSDLASPLQPDVEHGVFFEGMNGLDILALNTPTLEMKNTRSYPKSNDFWSFSLLKGVS